MTALAPRLSARQAAILEFTKRYYGEHGLPPVIREIQDVYNISSTSVVQYNLDRLAALGLMRLHRAGSSNRYIPVLGPGDVCPCCGRVL